MADLTPEHTARHPDSDSYSEVTAAYQYVESVISTADAQSPVGGRAWHGWALREAFLAGCTHVHSATSQPAPPADVSQLSDGYHTFADLYEHRHSLMLALMRALSDICWFSRRHADGELPFGSDDWFIVGAELPGAPITYHLPAALYPLAQKTGALELPTGRPWDGHSAADVVQRLRDWAIAPAPPADGEVTPDSCNRGLLPMIVSATGDPNEPELERIICSSISGGADYLNGMPRELSLQRIAAEGSVFARYIQGPRSPELTLNSAEQSTPPAELSPEAQAVSDAVKKISPASADEIAAAALRAAAKRVGPSEILPPGYAYSAPAEELHYQFRLREMNQLLGVAAELDLCQPGPGRAGAGGEQ